MNDVIKQDMRSEEEDSPILDLPYYWMVLKKRVWIIVIAMGIVLLLTAIWTLRQPRVYEARSSLIINPQAARVLGAQSTDVVQLGSEAFWANREYYNTQHEKVRSRTIVEHVVREYKLHQPPFPQILMPELEGASAKERLDKATEILRKAIEVIPKDESRIVEIAIRDQDPKLAAVLADAVRDVFIEQNVVSKVDTTRGATRWVAEHMDDARKELADAEKQLYEFKNANNILSIDLKDRQNMTTRALEEYSIGVTDAKKKRIHLETQRTAIAALLSGDTLSAPSTFESRSPLLDVTRNTYVEERRKLAGLQERYGAKHPKVTEQTATVSRAMTDFRNEGQVMLKSINQDISALRASERRYQEEVDRVTQEGLALNKKEGQYKALSRNIENSEANYQLLLRRLKESDLQAQDQENNMHPLDEARVAESPVEPNRTRAAILGFVLASFLGLGLAFLAENLDRSIKSQRDIEAVLGLPFLGVLPSVAPADDGASVGTPELHIANHPNSPIAECCRVVRTNIVFCSAGKSLRSFSVTSSSPIEGKTMSVVNLGVVMSQSGHRTLLVDSDMRRPRLHKLLGCSNEHGLSNLLVGAGSASDAVKSTEVPNLFILPCGPIPPNPSELLQTENFSKLVEELTSKYDRVIFDSPPVLAVTDAAILANAVDGTILVARAGRTSRDAIQQTKGNLINVRANILGVILNDVSLKDSSYYGGYYHYEYTTPESGVRTPAQRRT